MYFTTVESIELYDSDESDKSDESDESDESVEPDDSEFISMYFTAVEFVVI